MHIHQWDRWLWTCVFSPTWCCNVQIIHVCYETTLRLQIRSRHSLISLQSHLLHGKVSLFNILQGCNVAYIVHVFTICCNINSLLVPIVHVFPFLYFHQFLGSSARVGFKSGHVVVPKYMYPGYWVNGCLLQPIDKLS